jgi:hypothetical protein
MNSIYECIVGDMETNSNGHKYTAMTWHMMFDKIKTPGVFACYNSLSPDEIAAKIIDYEITMRNLQLSITLRVLDTPQGNILQYLLDNNVEIYVTPVGTGNLLDGVVFSDNYTFNYFNLTSEKSAFKCATPLKEVI